MVIVLNLTNSAVRRIHLSHEVYTPMPRQDPQRACSSLSTDQQRNLSSVATLFFHGYRLDERPDGLGREGFLVTRLTLESSLVHADVILDCTEFHTCHSLVILDAEARYYVLVDSRTCPQAFQWQSIDEPRE